MRNPLVVATAPLLSLTLISAVLTAYKVSGTSYIIATVQGDAQFLVTDGAGTDKVLSNGFQNLIRDGAKSEVVSFST